MKAEETVMNPNELTNSWNAGSRSEDGTTAIERIAKDQAEISFNVGKQVGFEIGVEQGKVGGIAEGMKEVVEWINDTDILIMLSPRKRRDWHFKLKEWRLE